MVKIHPWLHRLQLYLLLLKKILAIAFALDKVTSKKDQSMTTEVRPPLELSKKNTESLAQQVYKRLRDANIVKAESVPKLPSGPSWQEIKEKSFKTGLKNREHYLKESVKTNLPWHHHAKQEDQYSELIVIDPTMAKTLLDSMPWNRRISPVSYGAYARDMSSENWIQTHESIAISVNKEFIDGQHRMLGTILSEKEELFYVTFNVPNEAKLVMDSGRKRSTADKLRFATDNKAETKLAAIARSMMRGSSNVKIKFTDSEIAEFAIKYQDIISWAIKFLPKKRADLQACAAKYALYYGKEKVEPFCNRYTNMLFNGPTDPAKALFVWLENQKKAEQLTVYRKSNSALDHDIHNRQIKNLYEKEQDLFKFDDNLEFKKK